MATTKIPAIYGQTPSRLVEKNSHKLNFSRLYEQSIDKAENFVRYCVENETIPDVVTDSEDDSDAALQDANGNFINEMQQLQGPEIHSTRCPSPLIFGTKRKRLKSTHYQPKVLTGCSYNFADYLLHRGYGLHRLHKQVIDNEYGSQQMVKENLYREAILPMENVDKVFCSQWLTDDQIVMGTKCNKLVVHNVKLKRSYSIPCLRGSRDESSLTDQGGIHAIRFNPSRTLLATGAQNSNELAIYRLPTLDPVCMGKGGHSDWIFDMCWLDNESVVTGSRDKFLSLWKIKNDDLDNLSYSFIKPFCRRKCLRADKVRSLVFNENNCEIVALSLNAQLHIWDAHSFRQKCSQRLEISQENVCLAKNESSSMYAVGSKAHATLIDTRTLQTIIKIDTRKNSPQIRSLTFGNNLLTMGTGTGDVLFYDIRGARYFDASSNSELECSKCEALCDDASLLQSQWIRPAVYTHAYDWSGTRLFTAGGPLSVAFRGSYTALWC